MVNFAKIRVQTFRPMIAAGLFSIGSLMPALGHADTGGDCTRPPTKFGACKIAQISGQSQADSSGALMGAGALEIGGKVLPIHWVSVITSVVAGADGTLTMTSSHHITSDNGNIDFTTADAVVALPTCAAGQYTFTAHLTIQGSGRVHGGFLDVSGLFDSVAGHVTIVDSQGAICANR